MFNRFLIIKLIVICWSIEGQYAKIIIRFKWLQILIISDRNIALSKRSIMQVFIEKIFLLTCFHQAKLDILVVKPLMQETRNMIIKLYDYLRIFIMFQNSWNLWVDSFESSFVFLKFLEADYISWILDE